MNLKSLTAGCTLVALAACGGGGSGTGNPLGTVTPVTPVAPVIAAGSRATTSISLLVPRNDNQASPVAPSSTVKKPSYISPGQNNITFILDGVKILNDAVLLPATTTSPDGNTTVTVTYVPTPTTTAMYYTYTIAITTPAGQHTIGVEILGNAPGVILSENQATYTLVPGPNPAATLTLQGVLGSGYIECANGPVDSTNCASSDTAGTYQLTGIGADFDGFPIAFQTGIKFDNGGFSVVEADTNAVVLLTQVGAPFTSPGTQLTGPSGGYYVPAQAQYGQPFTATCLKQGTATLMLANAATGPNTPLTGETYSTFDPSNNFPTTGSNGAPNYPGAGTLATGSKTYDNPYYHHDANPNAVSNLPSITCTPADVNAAANLNLTINAVHKSAN